MKVLALLSVIAVVTFGAYLWLTMRPMEKDHLFEKSTIYIGDKIITVEIARSMHEHAQGLMYRGSLEENGGMLFVFNSKLPRTFWNKNTKIPLDVIWIRDGEVIGVDQLPIDSSGLKRVSSPTSADMVLEMNTGWAQKNNVDIGARVQIK